MAQLLVIALIAGGIPMAASPVIVQPQSAPAFTLDICSPLASFALGAGSCSLPPLPACSFPAVTENYATLIEAVRMPEGRLVKAPDPPPPKFLV